MQLAHVSAFAKQATISVACSLISDPLLGSDSWADQVRQLCDLQIPEFSTLPTPSVFFQAQATTVVELLRPPHVFCGTAAMGSSRLISVEIQNHLDVDVTVRDLQLYLCPKQAAGSGGDSPFDAGPMVGPAKGLKGGVAKSGVPLRMMGLRTSPSASPGTTRKAYNITPPVVRKGIASPLVRGGTSDGTRAGDGGQPHPNPNSNDAAEAIGIAPLNVMLPEVLTPETRHSFMFALKPPVRIPSPPPPQQQPELEPEPEPQHPAHKRLLIEQQKQQQQRLHPRQQQPPRDPVSSPTAMDAAADAMEGFGAVKAFVRPVPFGMCPTANPISKIHA